MIEELVGIADLAGREILNVYHSNFEVQTKSDESPVTEADLAAHSTIVRELQRLDPTIPIVSEEAAVPEYRTRKSWQRYWLIDPLDGTRNFVERNGEFTVNIALVQAGRPALGVVGAPSIDCIYSGEVAARRALKHHGGKRKSITTRMISKKEAILVESRHNTTLANELISKHLAHKHQISVTRTKMGSSLKICVIAEGLADLYLRIGPTSEWDIAAANAVLLAANGDLRLIDGTSKRYNEQESVLNCSFFACGNDPEYWTNVVSDALPELN